MRRCLRVCAPPGKLLQRFASKVDSLVKTFARQAPTKARMQLGCGELVFAMVGQQRGDAHVDLVRLLHIASHPFYALGRIPTE